MTWFELQSSSSEGFYNYSMRCSSWSTWHMLFLKMSLLTKTTLDIFISTNHFVNSTVNVFTGSSESTEAAETLGFWDSKTSLLSVDDPDQIIYSINPRDWESLKQKLQFKNLCLVSISSRKERKPYNWTCKTFFFSLWHIRPFKIWPKFTFSLFRFSLPRSLPSNTLTFSP